MTDKFKKTEFSVIDFCIICLSGCCYLLFSKDMTVEQDMFIKKEAQMLETQNQPKVNFGHPQ